MKSSDTHIAKYKEWYTRERPKYEALSNVVKSTILALLYSYHIDYVTVECRTKTLSSFLDKILKKKYSDPAKEITDLSGVRIITYVERDIEPVKELIRQSFDIHEKDSLDKSSELGEDRFGYRSLHYVCDIGTSRENLPEFSSYKNMCFEIQIRTTLQHTWAEIEHDRSYKFSGSLPSHLKRRFNLVSGLLEIADREFSALTDDIDKYKKEVEEKTRTGDLDIEINSTSVNEYLINKLEVIKDSFSLEHFDIEDDFVLELERFGVTRISDLEPLFTKEFFEAEKKIHNESTTVGVLRDAMMSMDIDKYFDKAWKNSWKAWDVYSINMQTSKYGSAKINSILKTYDIERMYSDM